MTRKNRPSGAEDFKVLDDLLRGEISAAETYQQALDRQRDDGLPEADLVRSIQLEHGSAIRSLNALMRSRGEEPSEHSGAWGTWARTVQGTAGVLGRKAMLKSLKEGEEHGLKEYRRALGNDDLSAAGRELIQKQLLPQTSDHIAVLDRLLLAV